MNIEKAFPSAYLKAADLQGKKPKVAIARVEMATFEGEGEKPVVYFTGKDSGLVLNKTRALALGAAFGPETDNWHGKTIRLGTVKVSMNGSIVDSITVEAATDAAQITASPQPEPEPPIHETDVPF